MDFPLYEAAILLVDLPLDGLLLHRSWTGFLI
jgi:hypothetical protein